MEDGLQKELTSSPTPDHINNGVASSVMANFPEGIVADTKKEVGNQFENSGPKFNGSVHSSDEADNDSDADALVIDESVPKRRVKKRKLSNRSKTSGDNCEESEVVLHSNPYFNESLFELSQQHNNSHTEHEVPCNVAEKCGRLNKSKRIKTKNSPKLREYAQYLGLQPAVQFKCSKCKQSGFETLQSLNEHLVNCTADPSAFAEVEDSSVSSFKLTRKVFLCSACGTYYENWNLYMHMLEHHRRFICLYCLGMFSVLDDLCQHIQSRHNWEPHQLETPADFFKDYKEPCFIICCECKKLFNEQDNFFYHNCVPCDNNSGAKNTLSKGVKNKCIKQQIRPENHVTGDSVTDNSGEINSLVVGCSSDTPVNKIKNSEMVRSSVNVPETSEVLPEMPDFNKRTTGTELTPQRMGSQTLEKSDSFEKDEHTEKQDNSDLEGSFSMETNDKQASSNLTIDTSNDEGKIDENSDKERDVNSPTFSEKQIYDQSSRDSDFKSHDSMNSDPEESRHPETENMSAEENVEPLETRKVPKLSLKLPKMDAYSKVEAEESDDSDKLGMEVDQIESENENEYINANEEKVENISNDNDIQVAGQDISIVELELEQPLDKFDIKILLQKCLLATVPSCVYCNHARKIAVNGKQLGLHAIAQHRYSAIVKSITEEELIPESFVNRIKESLEDLDKVYFNLESNLTEEAVTFSHVFECFQCRYSTNVHKELYLHNRKMHTKNLLLCIMCKSNFYSYSELICHLCPGEYVLDHDIQYRCCMCVSDDLPSAFRLMVHLRKRHHVCDVCLELCHNQYKLSNHVWKHKLHHFCYRCGIAYRNKQDITRHLFWKHGTESVLCKKCLQKKWPHVFHFCIPPAVFTCEECGLNLTKAVYLKVHKRIHADEKPHRCQTEGCEQGFISKKLLLKHEQQHLEPSKVEDEETKDAEDNRVEDIENVDVVAEDKKEADKPKPKVDVLDLPELNLSESSDSESENEAPKPEANKTEEENIIETLEERTLEVEQELANSVTVAQEEQVERTEDATDSSVPILESIWDDFKIYQAKREKIDNLFGESDKPDEAKPDEVQTEPVLTLEMALQDHDYFYDPESGRDSNVLIETEPDLSQRVDHDYCTPSESTPAVEKEEKEQPAPAETKKADNSDDSSSDSDSSSCSCGSNCSCSSDSSSSSSSDSSDSDSSTEEGRRRQQIRRENKNAKNEEKEPETAKVEPKIESSAPSTDIPILETDLDTTESETDEEFYDKQPQKLARKLLEEKRNQILAEVGSLPNGNMYQTSRNSTPSLPEEVKHKKKLKTKKRKKKKSERKETSFTEYAAPENVPAAPYPVYQSPVVAPLTISLNKISSPLLNQQQHVMATPAQDLSNLRQDTDSNLRASKRRRVPNKFYGYSSDEEADKSTPTSSKWRKVETQVNTVQRHSPLTVPPITIKTGVATTKQLVEPITIRQTAKSGELKVHQRQQQAVAPPPRVPPLQINTSLLPRTVSEEPDSDSNESTVEEVAEPEQPKVPVYCYCKCPYDEVSEMIGCDSHDCEIEWFHFECVGIMVPPKGQWFCPECRKKKQRRELMNF
ncbi:uncharacterized protein LOC123680630 [Harmonia axyridis]|uniref:uncharacterized protein LOC123680630 n=1 Tax=Harmonia axyridis TaxID=115357 RepID=UPI001E279498|nr:uncharacterized protein LOC123680630 [Harmonia axyridis]XP_045474574.1 uncharacterized protein LOC123680630 [Harmonia axyridis]